MTKDGSADDVILIVGLPGFILLRLNDGARSSELQGLTHTRVEASPCSVAEASARQEPPPKGLIVVAEAVSGELREDSHAHVYAATREGSCGFAALRLREGGAAIGSGKEAVAQLLGSAAIGDQFQGMRVVLLSEDADVRSIGLLAGAVPGEVPAGTSHDVHIRDLLFGNSASADAVVLHLRRDSPSDTAGLLDTLLAHVDADVSIKSSLYLVLLLGTEGDHLPDRPQPSLLPPHLAHLRPRQSCEPAAHSEEASQRISERAYMCIHRLECCVRVDDAAKATVAEIETHGARGTTLIEDILSEVAYKLGRAAKFGA